MNVRWATVCSTAHLLVYIKIRKQMNAWNSLKERSLTPVQSKIQPNYAGWKRHSLVSKVLTCRSSAEQRATIASPGLMFPASRADTRVPSSPFCLFTVCSPQKSHSEHEMLNSQWWRVEGTVRVGRRRSAYHAQQINEPAPICHRKAQFSRDMRWGETNHHQQCWTMAARLF